MSSYCWCINFKFFSSVNIAMEALDTLLVTCHAQSLNLFVESFLKMVQKLLECNDVDLQCLATASVCLMFIFDLLFWVWIILEIIFSISRESSMNCHIFTSFKSTIVCRLFTPLLLLVHYYLQSSSHILY